MDIVSIIISIIITFISNIGLQPAERIDSTPDRPPVVIVVGYNYGPVDVQPPQRLDWWLEHGTTTDYPPSDLDINVAEFTAECDDMGGTVTDTDGDTWVCQGIDY